MDFDLGEEAPPDPCLFAAQLRFRLSKKPSESAGELKNLLLEHNLETYAKYCAETVPSLGLSNADIAKMSKNNQDEVAKLEADVKDAEENHGEIEILQAKRKLADLYFRSAEKSKALEELDALDPLKGMSTGQKIDNCIRKIQLGLLWKDLDILQVNIEKCEGLLEVGGDWERRNKLRVYRGIYNLLLRNFEDASKDLLSTVATFTCTELCTYEQFIFYAVMTAIIALNRVEFKKQVIDSSQVKTVYGSFKWLPEFVNSLHQADYSTFFATMANLYPFVDEDRYMNDHAKWWVRELRIKSYAQFLEPFKSVTFKMMSFEFSLSEAFLDKELSGFIAAGRVDAKIDKANGVIESVKQTKSHVQYQEVIKQGDHLLNKVQQLTRLLGV